MNTSMALSPWAPHVIAEYPEEPFARGMNSLSSVFQPSLDLHSGNHSLIHNILSGNEGCTIRFVILE